MGRQYAGNRVDPEFLDAMGIRLVRGRNLRDGETGVAIVSEATARMLWPDEDALGKTLPWEPRRSGGHRGCAQRLDCLRRQSRAVGILRTAVPGRRAGIRPADPCVRLARRCRRRLQDTARDLDDRLQPTVQIVTDIYDREVANASVAVAVISILGTVAILLSVIGLAGLAGYTVAQRTREIGLRIALGARAGDVVRAVLAPMRRPIVIGFVGGALAGAAAARVLRSGIPTMSGLDVLDPLPYVMAMAFFAMVVALSVLAPGRRAVRIDPLTALRHE